MTSIAVPEHMNAFVQFGMKWTIHLWQKLGSCNHSHSWTSVSLPHYCRIDDILLLWHRQVTVTRWDPSAEQWNTTQCMSDTRMAVVHSELLYNPPCCLGCWSNALVTDSAVVRKWDWLCVIGCESKSRFLLCKFLNSFRGGKSALIRLGMMLKNDTVAGEVSCVYWNSLCFNFYVLGSHSFWKSIVHLSLNVQWILLNALVFLCYPRILF